VIVILSVTVLLVLRFSKNYKYLYVSLGVFIIISLTMISVYTSVNAEAIDEWNAQVEEELNSSSCDDMVENYFAYERQYAKDMIRDRYIMECVADKSDLMMMP